MSLNFISSPPLPLKAGVGVCQDAHMTLKYVSDFQVWNAQPGRRREAGISPLHSESGILSVTGPRHTTVGAIGFTDTHHASLLTGFPIGKTWGVWGLFILHGTHSTHSRGWGTTQLRTAQRDPVARLGRCLQRLRPVEHLHVFTARFD